MPARPALPVEADGTDAYTGPSPSTSPSTMPHRPSSSLPRPLARLLIGTSLLLTLHVPVHAEAPPPLQTIDRLDVARYLGTWHEIAKYPNRFQRKCSGNAQADYRLLDDGEIEVRNRCRQRDGSIAEAIGRARQQGGPDAPRLKVRFAPAWLSFLPVIWGDYWIVDLDPDYQLAAVSEPAREYLWILSRHPQVDENAYQALLARLKAQSFNLERLERNPGP